MTDDLLIKNAHAENRTIVGMAPEENTPGLRVFRISPDSIQVQVRTNHAKTVRIAGVGISRREARRVAARLIQFANGGN